MTEALFGLLTAPINVEEAVLGTLREWLPAYLAAVEEQNELKGKALGRPPAPESYKGGLDWESVRQEYLPAVIVTANPVGEPERQSETYIQAFQVEVGCVVLSNKDNDPEGEARKQAALYAAAVMGAIVQHSGLGHSPVEQTILTGSPRVEFFDTDRRQIAVGITTYRVYAELMVSTAGPVTLKAVEPEGPYPNDPEVKTTKQPVTAKTVSEAV